MTVAFTYERPPFLWLLEREVLRYLRIWRYSMAGPVLSTLLFVVVFGKILARDIGVADYGRFIVPGLVAQAVVNVGFYNGTTSLYEARRDRYINDVFASPVRWWEINAALVLAAVIRGILVSLAVLAFAVPLTGIGVARPGYLLIGGFALLLIAAQAGVIAGALANSLDDVYSIESLVILPLGFLGGIFYSVNQLPGVWAVVSHLNPVFWLVQTARIGFLGSADVNPIVGLAVVWGAAVVLTGLSARLFATSRRLKP
ncbi:ABC transporter permease [Smaragdicoccus niigatensis]|uniref:ABC transporter permease n=1 Tax=Smaragdicoccus niigatensis TaxID=359359 RepID=UPI00036D1C88|nr:ABC transporter permease [Smaragdicoccus niigatensis]